MATPVVLTTGARPIVPVESGGVPMTPVDTLGEPVTVVDTLGEPVVLINEDGTPAFLAYSAKTYLGGVAPYHWLDFINNRALYAGADVGNVTGATGYSFTRASQGYYTNSDGTLTLFGYNLLVRSEQFDNASWAKQETTVTANATTAPDGTLTADKLTPTAVNSPHQATQLSVVSSQTCTISFYAKAAGYNSVETLDGASGVNGALFNLATETVTNKGSGVGSMTAVGNGWYRCVVLYVTTGARIYVNNSSSYTGDGTSGIFIWGAQLEIGFQATAYVPTTTAAAGALRRGDRGVLIEGSRTNLLLRSQEFDNAGWTKNRATVTANATTAPDGTLTADKLVEDNTASNTHRTFQNVSTTGQAYAFTVFAKASERNWMYLRVDRAGPSTPAAWFDLSAGTVGTVNTGLTAAIQALANGWYRCRIVVDTADTASNSILIGLATGDNVLNYTGDNTSGIFIWGAQLEAASFASSYIPTVAAAATRAADVLTYTAGVSYPASLWCEFELPVNALSSQALLQLDAGSINDRQLIYVATSARTIVDAASVTQAFISVTGTVAANTTTKLAGRTATNSVQVARGGTLGTEDTLVTQPATPTRLLVGIETTAGGSAAFGYIRRIAVFTTALTDAQLQTTTGS